MNKIEILQAVRRTLNSIPVTGIDSVSMMLGCMHGLDEVIDSMTREVNRDADSEDNG